MAQRWSFSEDFIIAKFCKEHRYLYIDGILLDELISMLRQNGFSSRSKSAVRRRAKDFMYLFSGWESPCASNQVKMICGILNNESYESHIKEIKLFIEENQQTHANQTLELFNESQNNLANMVHKAKGRRFIDVFEGYIQRSGIRPKSRIYRDVGMKQETYSSIRRGKYKNVSRENVYRLCFGLRLRYDDAMLLINSCGYSFRGDSVLDSVVEYFLMQGPTKASVNKIYENEDDAIDNERSNKRKRQKSKEQKCYIYDTYLIDADLQESKVPELFWGFQYGDDQDEY